MAKRTLHTFAWWPLAGRWLLRHLALWCPSRSSERDRQQRPARSRRLHRLKAPLSLARHSRPVADDGQHRPGHIHHRLVDSLGHGLVDRCSLRPAIRPLQAPTILFGTDSDAFGRVGQWQFTLTVKSHPITQSSPTSGSVTTTGSAAFTNQITMTGNSGAVTFAKTGGGAALAVSSSGQITTTGTLAIDTYTATGSHESMLRGAPGLSLIPSPSTPSPSPRIRQPRAP